MTFCYGNVRRITSAIDLGQPDISRMRTIGQPHELQTDIWKFPVMVRGQDVRRVLRLLRQNCRSRRTANAISQLAFLSDSGGHANLWVVNIESGQVAPGHSRARSERGDGHPGLVADGRSIAFVRRAATRA